MNKAKNHQMIITIGISIVMMCAISTSTFAWTKSAEFESGISGQIASGTDALSYAGSATTVSGTLVKSGIKAAKMAWTSGMNGWGACHGEITFPTNVSEGGEVWFRAYTYFQPGWIWNSGDTKIMRLKTASGHLSIIARNGKFFLGNEVEAYNSSWQSPIQTTTVPNGEWVCLEMYVKFSATNGIIRMWKNGVLFAEDTTRPTMDTGNPSYLAYLMNTWNSPGCPQAQVQYLDSILLTNERPTNRDASGNYMIGPKGWSGASITDTISPIAVKGVTVRLLQ